jgi:hypothetical protein
LSKFDIIKPTNVITPPQIFKNSRFLGAVLSNRGKITRGEEKIYNRK